MLTTPQSVSNGRKWHIDHINNAPSSEVALQRAFEWIKAELRDCQVRRPQDADGLRWVIIHDLAEKYGHEIHRSRPPAGFRYDPPKLPGGGWVQKPGANVREP
jgi:hypothetical protein